jgi:hypothetical protein
MSHLFSAITDIFHSIYELIASFVLTIWSIISTVVDQVFGFVAGIFSLVSHAVVGVLEVVGETGKFLIGKFVSQHNTSDVHFDDEIFYLNNANECLHIGNVFVIGAIALGGFVWLRYQAQQGNTIKVGDKKLN